MRTDMREFCTFASMLMQSDDVDPVYPVLRNIVAGLPVERGLWLTFLYLAHYNLASGYKAFLDHPDVMAVGLGALAARHYPIAAERRGLRNRTQFEMHVMSYMERVADAGGSQFAWICDGWGTNPHANFLSFWDRACTVYQNGRWAAFKWAELLKEVHGLNLAAPDMRLRDCTGPVEGLQMLFGDPTDDPDRLDDYARSAKEILLEDGQDLSWERVETILCKWKMLLKGNYYVGRDIDELQEVIEHARDVYLPEAHIARLYLARLAALPNEFLGELQGWRGVRRDWLTLYRDQRTLKPSILL